MSKSEDGESRGDRELRERESERERERERERDERCLSAEWILPAGSELLTLYSFILYLKSQGNVTMEKKTKTLYVTSSVHEGERKTKA